MKKIACLLILLATPAAAQQATPAIDRIAIALGQCVGATEQRVDQIADLQKQLAAAQVRIKELEKPPAKPE